MGSWSADKLGSILSYLEESERILTLSLSLTLTLALTLTLTLACEVSSASGKVVGHLPPLKLRTSRLFALSTCAGNHHA